MQFEKITLDEIIPSSYNPRVISEDELAKLEKNIKEFGLVDPIIVNLKNNHIIGGHQRYEVLRKQAGNNVDYNNISLNLIKLGNIGWVFTDTDMDIKDDSHEKALNLALNKINGEWDIPKLNQILDELDSLNFDINLTGFEDIDVLESRMYDEIVWADDTATSTNNTTTSASDDTTISEDDTCNIYNSENYDNKEGLTLEEIYEEPPKKQLQCPKCNHIDVVDRFKIIK